MRYLFQIIMLDIHPNFLLSAQQKKLSKLKLEISHVSPKSKIFMHFLLPYTTNLLFKVSKWSFPNKMLNKKWWSFPTLHRLQPYNPSHLANGP